MREREREMPDVLCVFYTTTLAHYIKKITMVTVLSAKTIESLQLLLLLQIVTRFYTFRTI